MFTSSRRIIRNTRVVMKSSLSSIQSASTSIEAVGPYYQEMLYKYRGSGGILPLRELKKILTSIEKEEDGKFALMSVQLYQTKGIDFSEEIASLFVNCCIRTNKTKECGDMIGMWKNRIGAWIAPAPLERLVTTLLTEKNSDNINTAASVIATRLQKGLPFDLANDKGLVESVLEACVSHGLQEAYDKVINSVDNDGLTAAKLKERYVLQVVVETDDNDDGDGGDSSIGDGDETK